jgi:hypothetical protein
MIPYEELVAALERYAARKSGAPVPARQMPSAPPPVASASPAQRYSLPQEDYSSDATHVGEVGHEEHGEIDLGDVLSDDEL